MAEVQIPTLQNIEGTVSNDGKTMKLDFISSDGQRMTVGLTDESLTKLVSFIVGLGVASAEKAAQDQVTVRQISTDTQPIPISEMGASRGREPTEALLTIRAGMFQMLFAVSTAVLVDTLRTIEPFLTDDQSARKPN